VTPKLALVCRPEEHLKDVVLLIRKADDKPVEYLKIEIEMVLITAVSTGRFGGGNRLTENIALNFAKVCLNYVSQDDKGAPGSAIPTTWEIATNTSK
jgi:type VI secretion system secreted protein Hcp